MFINKTILRAILVILGLLIIFCILEFGLHLYINYFASKDFILKYGSLRQLNEKLADLAYWESDQASKFRVSSHRYLGYYPTPNFRFGKNKHNSLGFRGDEFIISKPWEEFRIVCIGGSTTYTTRVDDYQLSYPALLEFELNSRGYDNVRVINAGVPGWTT